MAPCAGGTSEGGGGCLEPVVVHPSRAPALPILNSPPPTPALCYPSASLSSLLSLAAAVFPSPATCWSVLASPASATAACHVMLPPMPPPVTLAGCSPDNRAASSSSRFCSAWRLQREAATVRAADAERGTHPRCGPAGRGASAHFFFFVSSAWPSICSTELENYIISLQVCSLTSRQRWGRAAAQVDDGGSGVGAAGKGSPHPLSLPCLPLFSHPSAVAAKMSTRYVVEITAKPKAKCMACKQVIGEVRRRRGGLRPPMCCARAICGVGSVSSIAGAAICRVQRR